VLAVAGAGAMGLACAPPATAAPVSPPATSTGAADSAAGTVSATVTPTAVPVLGRLTLGSFPATSDGSSALTVCQQWAGLRGQYLPRLRQDSSFQLEQWFSTGPQWLTAFSAASPLKTDPRYLYISTAFGLVSTAAAASESTARLLDQACAAAD
jgi:hypothetical protein